MPRRRRRHAGGGAWRSRAGSASPGALVASAHPVALRRGRRAGVRRRQPVRRDTQAAEAQNIRPTRTRSATSGLQLVRASSASRTPGRTLARPGSPTSAPARALPRRRLDRLRQRVVGGRPFYARRTSASTSTSPSGTTWSASWARRATSPGVRDRARASHHVQQQLGTSDEVRWLQSENPADRNPLSVRLELQADCYAGVWASTVFEDLEPGDIEEAITASVRRRRLLQGRAGGQINPDTFTHGSSRRVRAGSTAAANAASRATATPSRSTIPARGRANSRAMAHAAGDARAGPGLGPHTLDAERLAALGAGDLGRRERPAVVAQAHGWAVIAGRPAVAPGHQREERLDELGALLGQEVVVTDGVVLVGAGGRARRPLRAARAERPAACATGRGSPGCRRSR